MKFKPSQLVNKWVKPSTPTPWDMDRGQSLFRESQALVEKLPPLNILLVGKTGVGKSTLINAMFREELALTGIGLPVTQTIEKLSKPGLPLNLYDSKGLELSDQSRAQVTRSLFELIDSCQKQGPSEAIHLVYYCIHGSLTRVESEEIDLIRQLQDKAPLVIVLTQAIREESQQMMEFLQEVLPDIPVHKVLAKSVRIMGGHKIEAYGLEELVYLSVDQIPDQVRPAFINAQKVAIRMKEEEAKAWVRKYLISSFGVGFTPLPLSDAAVLIPMQVTMLAHITAIFGIRLDQGQLMSILAGVGGTGTTTMVGRFLTGSLAKFIPFIPGNWITGITASSLTMSLGYAYIEVLKQIAEWEIKGQLVSPALLRRTMNQALEKYIKHFQAELSNKRFLKGSIKRQDRFKREGSSRTRNSRKSQSKIDNHKMKD